MRELHHSRAVVPGHSFEVVKDRMRSQPFLSRLALTVAVSRNNARRGRPCLPEQQQDRLASIIRSHLFVAGQISSHYANQLAGTTPRTSRTVLNAQFITMLHILTM